MGRGYLHGLNKISLSLLESGPTGKCGILHYPRGLRSRHPPVESPLIHTRLPPDKPYTWLLYHCPVSPPRHYSSTSNKEISGYRQDDTFENLRGRQTDVYNIFSRESDSRIANVRPSVSLSQKPLSHSELLLLTIDHL